MDEPIVNLKESWWQRWLLKPVTKQLMVGMSSERISWTISLGIVLGVFPILGTPTLICLLFGWAFGLNQAVLQVFKELAYPLHLILILVFIRLGEQLYRVPVTSFSVHQLIMKFKDDPLQFTKDFGVMALQGVSAWLLIAPFAAILIKISVMPMVKKLSSSLQSRKGIKL